MFKEDEFEILKDQAEGLEVPVREKVWQNISSRLRETHSLNVRLKKLSVVLFICLLISFSITTMLENSKQGNIKPTHSSQVKSDLIPENNKQNNDHPSAGNDLLSIPGSHLENNYPLADAPAVNYAVILGSEKENALKTEDTLRTVVYPDLKKIPSLTIRPFELTMSFRSTGLMHKREKAPDIPQKGINLSSVNFGIGSALNYSKKQPQTSTPIEQNYVQHITKTTKKMIPVSGSILVNVEWPGRLSIGTGLQFLQFHERVSYNVISDSFIVLVDDGRGGFDTNTFYYDNTVPGIGNTIESRTSLLQLPILLNFHWKLHKKLYAGINAGINLGLYSAHRSKSAHHDLSGITSFMTKLNHSSFLYSIGTQVSAGFEYRISQHGAIALKYNYYGSLWNKSGSFNVIQRSFGSELSYKLYIR